MGDIYVHVHRRRSNDRRVRANEGLFGHVNTIHLALTGGAAVVVSTELWSYHQELASARFKVTFSDGSEVFARPDKDAYEYVENRIPVEVVISPGYYRFLLEKYYDEVQYEFVFFTPVWTDWYYLTSDMDFDDGYPY